MVLNLDLGAVQEKAGFDVLPQGKYLVITEAAEVKSTRAGTGEYIKVELKVLEPESLIGRKVWTNFNIKNPNPEAVEIGLGQLKHFMRVAGLDDPSRLADVRDLMGRKVVASVKIKNDPQYGESNEVKAFDEPAKWASAPGGGKAALDAAPF